MSNRDRLFMDSADWILIWETNGLKYAIIPEKKRGKNGEKSFPKSGGNFAESIFSEINRFATSCRENYNRVITL